MKTLGWVGFALLLAASCGMAGTFAFDLGMVHSEKHAWLFAFAGGSLIATECAFASSRRAWALLALAPVALAVLSLEIGFSSTLASDARAARQREAGGAELARNVELPANVLRLQIEAHRASHRDMSAAWCSSADEARRSACQTWQQLRQDLALAEHVERGRPTGDADARAALLQRLFGGALSAWGDALIVLLSVAFSAARMAAARALLCPEPAKEQPKPPPAEHKEVAPVEPQPAETVVAVEPEPLPAEPAPSKKRRVDISKPAAKVLRVVKAEGGDAQGFIGSVPPIGQRLLAEKAKLPRRTVAQALGELEAAGLARVAPSRDGTVIEVLK